MGATERLASQATAMAEANTILRKIAAHIPAKVWMEAKEKAGYGTEVRATQLSDPKVDEAWLEFVSTEQRHRLIQDDDCHWYVIPVEEVDAFNAWLAAGPYWENYQGPRFDARQVNGPHSVSFLEWDQS
jgi:hypothetical protein